jgi:hypothetical protein
MSEEGFKNCCRITTGSAPCHRRPFGDTVAFAAFSKVDAFACGRIPPNIPLKLLIFYRRFAYYPHLRLAAPVMPSASTSSRVVPLRSFLSSAGQETERGARPERRDSLYIAAYEIGGQRAVSDIRRRRYGLRHSRFRAFLSRTRGAWARTRPVRPR